MKKNLCKFLLYLFLYPFIKKKREKTLISLENDCQTELYCSGIIEKWELQTALAWTVIYFSLFEIFSLIRISGVRTIINIIGINILLV